VNRGISAEKISIDVRSEIEDLRTALAKDVRDGLLRPRKELPPKYFYDERGANLFEAICDLPEYYQTRTEGGILRDIAGDLVARHAPGALVEFGSGSSSKTRLLLDAMRDAGTLRRYVPIDISREMLLATAESLVAEYPGLQVEAVIGDFTDGPPDLPAGTSHLIIFLGSTIGNFHPDEARAFVSGVAAKMGEDDLFLLGVDLVKDPAVLHAAYNDAAGVTADFNLNILQVINRELGGEFRLETFRHYAFFNPGESRIEMHLASLVDQDVPIGALDISIPFMRGETVLTEISRKFTRPSVAALLAEGGMELLEVHTDPDELFALCLARRGRAS
jgi:L-histidine N-alpha-methyltransferase